MDIKNFLNKKKEKKAKKIWIFLIGMIVVSFIVGIIFLNKTSYTPSVEHFIGEKISVSGTIYNDNNYPANTHKISNNLESFGLKDNAINLNNFLGIEVEIDGNISEITSKYPILIISKLKIPAHKLSISDNKYFYVRDLISFDFSKDIDVYSQKTGGKIIVYYQNEPILYVDTFICNSLTDNQNCEKIKHNYIVNLNEAFQSALGYIFYRNKENSWVTFNDNNIGYIITANSDEEILSVSHLINIVNSDFLRINKNDLLLSGCSNNDIVLKNISNVEKWIVDDDLIKLLITGKTTEGKLATCRLNVDIFNDREIVNSSVELTEDN